MNSQSYRCSWSTCRHHVVAINRAAAITDLRGRCEGHEPDPLPDNGQQAITSFTEVPHGRS